MDTTTESMIVACSKCGHVLGETQKISDLDWLVINGLIVNHVVGVCKHCGHEFYYSAGGKKLSQLIQSMQKME